MKLLYLSILIEFERVDNVDSNEYRLRLVLSQLHRSKLGPATILKVINSNSEGCVVPFFGYNNETWQPDDKPKHGVQREFGYYVLVQVPDETNTFDLFGDYTISIQTSRTIHHEAKAVFTVCGVEFINSVNDDATELSKGPTVKGYTEIVEGETVPEYVEQLHLPIKTHRPSKYAVVDLQTGQIWIASKPDPSKPVEPTQVQTKLLKELVRRY